MRCCLRGEGLRSPWRPSPAAAAEAAPDTLPRPWLLARADGAPPPLPLPPELTPAPAVPPLPPPLPALALLTLAALPGDGEEDVRALAPAPAWGCVVGVECAVAGRRDVRALTCPTRAAEADAELGLAEAAVVLGAPPPEPLGSACTAEGTAAVRYGDGDAWRADGVAGVCWALCDDDGAEGRTPGFGEGARGPEREAGAGCCDECREWEKRR